MGLFDGVNNKLKSFANDLSNNLPSSLNKKGGSNQSAKQVTGPWSGASKSTSFFKPISIDGERWNQLYPYSLVVVNAEKASADGVYPIVTGAGNASATYSVSKPSPGRYNITFQPMANIWEFRLPITPQQLSISNAFAINTSATLKGVVEEHNGTKFKTINCTGTMGVWPYKESVGVSSTNESALQTLFAGTLEAFSGLKNQVARTIRSVTSSHPAPKPEIIKPENTSAGFAGTGYAQALLLDQFLEQYSEAKKDPANSGWRLAFHIPKQNQAFLVTPIQFAYQQSAESPNETKYSFQLKAWRRIAIAGGSKAISHEISSAKLDPNFVQRALTAVREARKTIGTAYTLVRAVRSDFQTPFNALRETALFLKETAGLPAAVADLPRQIFADFKDAISDVAATLSPEEQQSRATNNKIKSALQLLSNSRVSREGLSTSAVSSGQLGAAAATALATDPSNSLFENPEQNFEIFDTFSLDELNLNNTQQDIVSDELDRISQLTVDDLTTHRNTLLDLALQISNAYGAGSQEYSDIYDRPDPFQRLQDMTIDEFDVLKKLYDTIQVLDVMTATDELNERLAPDAMSYVRDLALESGFPFEETDTKTRAPVPFGLTIEQIAFRYLGDPDRWVEIVTLNALKSPYIDETGFERTLLSNASGRQFNISSVTDMFVGQRINLLSNNQPQQRRRVTNIEKINDTNYLITVDGLDNLDVFTTSQNARMRAYLPGTVNSQDFIFIPSELPVTDDLITRPVPATKDNELVGLSRIDWVMEESGDIAINSLGDFRLSYGLNNLVQALKIKFITPSGKLLKHPDFGAGINVGSSVSDTSATEIYNLISEAIQDDPRFSSIDRLEIQIDGAQVAINLSVQIANGQGVFPISFKLAG